MTDDYYRFDEKAHLLKGENAGAAYRLGDRVQVQVVRADLDRRQIDLVLVDVLERARGASRQPKPRPRRAAPPGGRAGAAGRRTGPRQAGRRRKN
jgi:ribonuclease R